MNFLIMCGRLNVVTLHVQELFQLVGPIVRAKNDIGHLIVLTQLAAKSGLAGHAEAIDVFHAVYKRFEALPENFSLGGSITQPVCGQLLLALIFDEAACETRDRLLVAAIQAVSMTFGNAVNALDERLTRQLQIAELACRLERPAALQALKEKSLLPFFDSVQYVDRDIVPLTKSSSQQHLQVSGVLQGLGIKHRLEERVLPYVADVRLLRKEPRLIEIDGPCHFVGNSTKYDMKSILKHRLLTKQGWQVHHIAWYDWPNQYHNRLTYVTKLLRSPAPGNILQEYRRLEMQPCTLGEIETGSEVRGFNKNDVDVADVQTFCP